MNICLSSIEKRGSFVAYRVLSKGNDSFTIISYAKDATDDFKLDGDFHAVIESNSISLTASDRRLLSVLQIGNKSLNQLKLGQLGFRIPNTVVLDFTFFDIFKKTGQIDLRALCNYHIAERLGPLLAIRCSSNLEDGERQSFAGAFDTYLDVPNEFGGFQERILRSYQRFHTIDDATLNDTLQDMRRYDLKLSIMVQRLVEPRFSGFLFTSDPMNPPNQWLRIEYWQGKREQSEGYSITLNSETGKRIPSSRDNCEIPLPSEFQEKLYCAARELVLHYGFPQDVEFVISDEDEQLYLVQSRPITAFSYSPDKVYLDEQKRLSEILKENLECYQKAPILSSTNISELFVRAVPLGYSIFRYGFAGTDKKDGGISIGRSRLGYAKLELEDQKNLFYTVADQARTNIIVDALTYRLPSVSKDDYLSSFVANYLKRIEQNPGAAVYPQDGLYLQDPQSELWKEIAGEKGEAYRIECEDFLCHVVEYHAPNEYDNAAAFFRGNEQFYRTHLNRVLHSASENCLKEMMEEILEYLRISFCPQYVVFARLAFLCTSVAKQKLKNLLTAQTRPSMEHILNELLRRVDVHSELQGSDYPLFERLLKASQITLWEFLDKFQHLGSLDINQPRLGEYSIEDLHTIFGLAKHYELSDSRLRSDDDATGFDNEVAALGLEKNADFWTWRTFGGRFMRLRENAKFELLKVLYVLKRTIRELARIHRLGDLVYYLEYDQVLELTQNTREKHRLLALQKRAYFEACRQYRVRDVLVDLRATPFEKVEYGNREEAGKRYESVKGRSIFYGYVEGVCLTAHSNDEYLKKLAAYRADKREPIIGVFKGLELSYFNLSALAGFTTENGGYLSHAATIAREFKMPYITGIKVDQFQDGDYVILDTENEQVIYRKI